MRPEDRQDPARRAQNEDDRGSLALHWSSPDEGREVLRSRGILPGETLRETAALALGSIEAPNPRRRPAAIRTTEGGFIPRIVFVTEDEVLRWHLPVWRTLVRAGEVQGVESSPDQIPPKLARVLWETGETSMGSLAFLVTMRDSRKLAYVYSGPCDFIVLSSPYRPTDITEITAGRGITKGFQPVGDEPDYAWCLYKP